jgi:hypothetical protein
MTDPTPTPDLFHSANADSPRDPARRVFIVSAAVAITGLAFFALRRAVPRFLLRAL